MPIRLQIDGIDIVPHAGAPSISVRPVSGRSRVRLHGGRMVQMTHWRGKVQLTVSGSGPLPVGLDGVDDSGPLELRSLKPVVVSTTATSCGLPGTPRPDHTPWCWAVMSDNRVRRTPVSVALSGQHYVATITPVDGAVQYKVGYLPVYTVFTDGPETGVSLSAGGANDWSISFEEQ
jgi:hypothetical protein